MGRDRDCVWAGGSGVGCGRGPFPVWRFPVLACALSAAVGLAAGPAWADNADVLPKGVTRAGVKSFYYPTIDERYGPDGHKEDVATDYDNRNLNSSVFPDLALVEAGFSMPAGTASLGTTMVDLEYDFTQFELTVERGVTNRVSVGIKIPYWQSKATVPATLDTTSATVGKSPTFVTLAPLGFADTVPLTTNDIQNLLGPGLDIDGDSVVDVPGFGYKRVGNWSHEGLSDVEAGARYQYLRTDAWHLAFTGAVRLPTGKVDDPNNLVDYGFGQGVYSLLFNFNNDFVASKQFVLDATLIYEWALPAKERLRVPADVNTPITTNMANVDRDVGDIYGIDLSGAYNVTPAVGVSARYRYRGKFRDDVSGPGSLPYQVLEQETAWKQHEYFVGVTYSTLANYMATHSGVPMSAVLSYRNRFKGTDNLFVSDYVALELKFYF